MPKIPDRLNIHVPRHDGKARAAVECLMRHGQPHVPGREGPTFSTLVIEAIIEKAERLEAQAAQDGKTLQK